MLELIAANLPIILCFLIGIGLLILEAFIPGFGAAGITGIILEVITLVMTYHQHGALATLVILLFVLLVLAIAISTSLRSITSGRLSKSALVHSETESNESGYRSLDDLAVFLDREGTTTSVLRPTGIGDFDGVRLNISSEGAFIPAGTRVRIIKVEGARIVVRAI